jgi:hypothetical protein
MKPSPRHEHEFLKSRGRAPADGNAKCQCGKRLLDPIHAKAGKGSGDSGKERFPEGPPQETFNEMLKRQKRWREAARRFEAKRMEGRSEADSMSPAEAELEWKKLLD